MTPRRVFIGFDAREMVACNVAETSMFRYASRKAVWADRICRLSLHRHYRRPTTTMPNGQLFDELSGAPMSTDHAIARFFVPFLCGYDGWALFTDGDVLFREDVERLFDLADPRYAVQVVQHAPLLEEGTKKDGHIQQAYARKNWSSVILWNCAHEKNRWLTLDLLNQWPGRDLHGFRWLDNTDIGSLPARWNVLNGLQDDENPALVHFTLGTPNLPGFRDVPYADEWFAMAKAAGYRLESGAMVAARG